MQEGLTNAIKHADAQRVEVHVSRAGDMIEVLVQDDGRGFDTGDATNGFGVIGMRERAVLVGGAVDLVSAPGAGTSIRAALPAARSDKSHARGRAAA